MLDAADRITASYEKGDILIRIFQRKAELEFMLDHKNDKHNKRTQWANAVGRGLLDRTRSQRTAWWCETVEELY